MPAGCDLYLADKPRPTSTCLGYVNDDGRRWIQLKYQPTGCRLYTMPLRVRKYEMDALGHVNNAVYLNYMEQAATEHAEALGFGQERVLRSAACSWCAGTRSSTWAQPWPAMNWASRRGPSS